MSIANTRFRTAVHAMAVIAYVPEQQATSDAIAASIATDASVVRKLLSLLREAGLVQGAMGRAGGYALSRPPGQITLNDVFVAVGGDDVFPESDRPTNPTCPVGGHIGTALEQPLAMARKSLAEGLSRTTVADVVASLAKA